MFVDFVDHPDTFDVEQRQRLVEAFAWLCDVVDNDPVVAAATVGVSEIAAFLDGRPGSETR
jgi:hypothetical protein